MPSQINPNTGADVRLERAWINVCPNCLAVPDCISLEAVGPTNFHEVKHCKSCKQEYLLRYAIIEVLEVGDAN